MSEGNWDTYETIGNLQRQLNAMSRLLKAEQEERARQAETSKREQETIAALQADRDWMMGQIKALGEARAWAQHDALAVLDMAIERSVVNASN